MHNRPRDTTWHDVTWRDTPWHDVKWRGLTWHDVSRLDKTWHVTRLGMTWNAFNWRDMTRHNVTWCDRTCDRDLNATRMNSNACKIAEILSKNYWNLFRSESYDRRLKPSARELSTPVKWLSKIQIFSPNWANGSQPSLKRSEWNTPEM